MRATLLLALNDLRAAKNAVHLEPEELAQIVKGLERRVAEVNALLGDRDALSGADGQPSKTDALLAHREALERQAAEAQQAGDQNSFDRTQLLLQQCEFLIQKARSDEDAGCPLD